ncbi:transthyretin-like family protein [Aureliella helgolandensis]|nr:hypothetical protein [Aureliella helgolandensis]
MNCLSVLLLASCFLAGCGGSGDGPVPAKGVVTFNGSPIAKISVSFVPVGGSGQIAEGTTDEQGNFKLRTLEPGDGAWVGDYQVSLKYVPDVIADMPAFTGGQKSEPSPIPAKYGNPSKSGFTATVDADASKNVFTFDL